LPSLALGKFKGVDLRVDFRNPFRVQKETELLLIAREKERQMKDITRIEKTKLHVFEKSIATRRNRSGVIREISCIKASKPVNKKKGSGIRGMQGEDDKLRAMSRESEREKNKINIFEESDTSLLQHENLMRWGQSSEEK
jgi:hypothetical protein